MTEAVLRERPAGWGLCCDGAISAVGGGGKRVGEAELHPGHSRLLRRHGATCPSEAEKEMERVGLTQFDPMQLRSHSTTRTPVVASPRTLVKSRLPEQEVDAGSHMMHPLDFARQLGCIDMCGRAGSQVGQPTGRSRRSRTCMNDGLPTAKEQQISKRLRWTERKSG
ncbi:hypothetical protein B296_00016888 [Ensete ventricosum]|uniref:Uncharacterized protein n=1 Tax=Ensete ventricosum TaxID=4639 RepID=A0A426Z674_ENSVE|nr:hypothetical protein B296_00016888 [Ensete ventricosum]